MMYYQKKNKSMNASPNYQKIVKDGQQYLRTRYNLLRLELLEKMGQIIAFLLLLFCCIILVLAAFIYFSFALVEWFNTMFNSEIIGFCLIGGVFLVILLLIYLFRDQLFLMPIIRQLSKILFKEIPEEPTPHEQS